MRYLLVLWLAIGVAPGVREVAEDVAHLVTAGHLAHSGADHDRDEQGCDHGCSAAQHHCGCCASQGDPGEQGCDHGCGTTEHRCGCCASQGVATAPIAVQRAPFLAAEGRAPADARLVSLHEPSPPLRPPIAS
jgi:hypothetical protein